MKHNAGKEQKPLTIRISDVVNRALEKYTYEKKNRMLGRKSKGGDKQTTTYDEVLRDLLNEVGYLDELDEIKDKIRNNKNIDEQNVLDVLKRIYLSEIIRYGVLNREIRKQGKKDVEKEVEWLKKDGVIEETGWYKNDVWSSTGKGKRAGKTLLKNILDGKKGDIKKKLDEIDPKLSALSILYLEETPHFSLTDEYGKPDTSRYLRGKRPLGALICDTDSIVGELTNLMEFLVELGVATKMTYYVSKGEPRGEVIVTAPEVVNVLKEHLKEKTGKGPDAVLKDEIRTEKVYNIIKDDRLELGHDIVSSESPRDILKKILEDQNLTWGDLKLEIESLKSLRRYDITISSLDDEQPITIPSEYRYEIAKNLRKSIVDSILNQQAYQ